MTQEPGTVNADLPDDDGDEDGGWSLTDFVVAGSRFAGAGVMVFGVINAGRAATAVGGLDLLSLVTFSFNSLGQGFLILAAAQILDHVASVRK